MGFRKPLFHDAGAWVSIRPCDPKHGDKTYLGVLLGDLPLSISVGHDNKTNEMVIMPSFHNPAIYVPDLKQIIMGCESWWGEIDSPDKLREITGQDIENVWYVRALSEITAKLEARRKEQEGKEEEKPIAETPTTPQA